MMPSLSRRGLAASLAACALLAGADCANAAVGSIDFDEFSIRLSDANRGPHLPVITVQLIDGTWRISSLPVEIALTLRTRVNLGSSVTRILVGVPGINLPSNTWQAFGGSFGQAAREVRVKNTSRSIPGDRLALVSLDAASRCAQAAPGKHGEFTLPFSIPVEVNVMATRGIINVEQRTKTYQATIPAQIRCVPLSVSHQGDKPQRTKVDPKRTKVEPQRTAPKFEVVEAELAFVRNPGAKGCPVEIRQSVRIVSKGPGRAKFYLVKQDGKGTLSGPYFVDVKTYEHGRYVGVARVTNTFGKSFAGAYRVVVANESGRAFESGWVELKVECGAAPRKVALNAPA